MTSKEDEELIARLLQEDVSNGEVYQEDSFINYTNNNNDSNNRESEMQRQMDQVLEQANLLRWEYENNLMNEKIEEEKRKEEEKLEQVRELDERRRIIAEQDRDYEEELNKNKPEEIPIRFICPISNKIMENPIYDEETRTHYEKSVLLKYLSEHNNKNQNGIPINRSKLIIDNTLKQEIFLWKREHYK